MSAATVPTGTGTPAEGRTGQDVDDARRTRRSSTRRAARHEPVVGRTPVGPRPVQSSKQRYGTTIACTCGWDFGLVTTAAPVIGQGARIALETHRRHLREEA